MSSAPCNLDARARAPPALSLYTFLRAPERKPEIESPAARESPVQKRTPLMPIQSVDVSGEREGERDSFMGTPGALAFQGLFG